ncbi:hypothetical protein [Anaerococcus sp. Marseille-P3915]|uniref:hypothetical protein n=1 Tax=Anaerococcus sp. Marseille-P3915 TaxID=2057799 RepID=UPI000D0AEC2B|nr:hypothetical protein [Anaerococcus sp. Marseille-P3915]
MLINPNLSTSSEFKRGVLNIYQDSLDVAYLDDNVLKIKKKKEAELGLIYMPLFDNIENDKIIAFSGKLNLINGREIEIYFNGFSGGTLHISNNGIYKIEAIGQKDSSYNQVQLRVYHNYEVIFRFTEIKLEKDEVTPYIPNINTIETAKRPYFIGGVRSKRFIQFSIYPRQSSFRKEVAA